MRNYTVRYKASVYYDITIEAPDKDTAREITGKGFDYLLNKATLPSPLEWEGVEAWDIEEQ